MMKKFTDVSLPEYRQCRVSSYTGGVTWYSTPWNVFFVIFGAPVEIRRYLESNPTETVRAEVLPYRN